MTVVRAAITQVAWTGDKESMIARHEELARDGRRCRRAGHRLPGAVLRPVLRHHQDQKYYAYVEPIPGPTVERFQALADELGLVIVLPIYEVANEGEYYNTAAVIDADGALLGKLPQAPHPEPAAVLGEVLLPARQPRLPGVRDRRRPGRRLHLLRPALPRGLARARAGQRADRVQPVGHQAGPVEPALGDRAAGRGRGQPVLRRREQPDRQRVGASSATTRRTSTAQSYFVDPRGNYVGEVASTDNEEIVIRDLDLDEISRARNDWQFYRDRRPDSYTKTTAP